MNNIFFLEESLVFFLTIQLPTILNFKYRESKVRVCQGCQLLSRDNLNFWLVSD